MAQSTGRTALAMQYMDIMTKMKGKPKRPDGVEAKVIKGRFKVELRNSICFALLRGNALAMNNQGCSGVVHPL